MQELTYHWRTWVLNALPLIIFMVTLPACDRSQKIDNRTKDCEATKGRKIIELDNIDYKINDNSDTIIKLRSEYERCERQFNYVDSFENLKYVAAYKTKDGEILLVYEMEFTLDVFRVVKFRGNDKILSTHIARAGLPAVST